MIFRAENQYRAVYKGILFFDKYGFSFPGNTIKTPASKEMQPGRSHTFPAMSPERDLAFSSQQRLLQGTLRFFHSNVS